MGKLRCIVVTFTMLLLQVSSDGGVVTDNGAPPKTIVPIGLADNFSAPSSSTSNPFSNHFRNGVNLALEELAGKLGEKGISIKLEEFDYANTNSQVLATANRAVASDVRAVLGYIYSTDALIAAPIFQKHRLLMISPTATADRLDTVGEYVRRTTFSDSDQAKLLATEAIERGIKRVSVVSVLDCSYCQSMQQAFEVAFKAKGGEVLESIGVLNGHLPSPEDLKKIIFATNDALLIPNHEAVSAKIIAHLYDQNIRPRWWLGGDGWGNVSELFFKIIGSRKVQALTISHWHATLPNSKTRDFVERYKVRFRLDPVDTSVLAYDGARFLFSAIADSNGYDRESILVAVKSMSQFEGVSGRMMFSKNAVTPKKRALLLEHRNRQTVVAD